MFIHNMKINLYRNFFHYSVSLGYTVLGIPQSVDNNIFLTFTKLVGGN